MTVVCTKLICLLAFICLSRDSSVLNSFVYCLVLISIAVINYNMQLTTIIYRSRMERKFKLWWSTKQIITSYLKSLKPKTMFIGIQFLAWDAHICGGVKLVNEIPNLIVIFDIVEFIHLNSKILVRLDLVSYYLNLAIIASLNLHYICILKPDAQVFLSCSFILIM
jgi:hypothetical protein